MQAACTQAALHAVQLKSSNVWSKVAGIICKARDSRRTQSERRIRTASCPLHCSLAACITGGGMLDACICTGEPFAVRLLPCEYNEDQEGQQGFQLMRKLGDISCARRCQYRHIFDGVRSQIESAAQRKEYDGGRGSLRVRPCSCMAFGPSKVDDDGKAEKHLRLVREGIRLRWQRGSLRRHRSREGRFRGHGPTGLQCA